MSEEIKEIRQFLIDWTRIITDNNKEILKINQCLVASLLNFGLIVSLLEISKTMKLS
jgi:predicted amino acid-binding ACT domain protein